MLPFIIVFPNHGSLSKCVKSDRLAGGIPLYVVAMNLRCKNHVLLSRMTFSSRRYKPMEKNEMSEAARCDLCENTLILNSQLINFLREWAEQQEQRYIVLLLHFCGGIPIYTATRADKPGEDSFGEPALSQKLMCTILPTFF